MRIKKKYKIGDYKLIQYQILQTNITRTIGRKYEEFLMRSWELEGLKDLFQKANLVLN